MPVHFVSPVVSTLLAASTIREECAKSIKFSGDCQNYAASNGLLDAIHGRYSFPRRGGQQGVTYTKLTRLATHAEVDACNAIINDLIYEQFAGYSTQIVGQLTKVVGELHDNVASHAHGAGFSCAQVYREGTNRRVEFSIVDAGRGMLANVSTVVPEIADETDAIQWCLRKGNTTVRPADTWAQRLPDDALSSPFPEEVETFVELNHHVGEGLWKLCELVKLVNGSLWLASGGSEGTGRYLLRNGRESTKPSSMGWNGVAIEFELTVPAGQVASAQLESHLEDLGRRLGL